MLPLSTVDVTVNAPPGLLLLAKVGGASKPPVLWWGKKVPSGMRRGVRTTGVSTYEGGDN